MEWELLLLELKPGQQMKISVFQEAADHVVLVEVATGNEVLSEKVARPLNESYGKALNYLAQRIRNYLKTV